MILKSSQKNPTLFPAKDYDPNWMNTLPDLTPELIAHRLPGSGQTSIIDLRETVSYTDYFIVCTVSCRASLLEAVASLRELAKSKGATWHVESSTDWTLIDLGSCVVHLFTPEGRRYWRLESLWGMTPQKAAVA